MGRYDLRPAQVHQAAARLLASGKLNNRPPWFDVVGSNPPSQILVRTQPKNHIEHSVVKQGRRAIRQFRPRKIAYEEDSLRKTFFEDHPWELGRPRVVLEDNCIDNKKWGRGSVNELNPSATGESVVQRQLFLMQGRDTPMDRSNAYDQARAEFYEQRLFQEMENRIAKEEAMVTGAYFGKTTVQVGAELENRSYETWRAWAGQTFTELDQKRLGGSITSGNHTADVTIDANGVESEEGSQQPP